MMQSKTSLRFALHATQSCIGELIEDCFLMGPGPPRIAAADAFASRPQADAEAPSFPGEDPCESQTIGQV
jgi:hypothetical protein